MIDAAIVRLDAARDAREEPLPPELLRFIRALAEADEAEDYARQLARATNAGQGQR